MKVKCISDDGLGPNDPVKKGKIFESDSEDGYGRIYLVGIEILVLPLSIHCN
jgi:hypothetical protein